MAASCCVAPMIIVAPAGVTASEESVGTVPGASCCVTRVVPLKTGTPSDAWRTVPLDSVKTMNRVEISAAPERSVVRTWVDGS